MLYESQMHFKGKTSFLTLASPQNIYHMEMKIGMVHKVRGINKYAKFHHATFGGSAPRLHEI
jgi:hypothetical protein